MPISGSRRMMAGWGIPPIDTRDASLALYLPLWYPDKETTGSTIISKDKNRTSWTVTGATYGYQGRTFDGNDLLAATITGADFTTGDFSIWAWIKSTNLTGVNTIWCRGLANTDGYLFQINSDDSIDVRTYQSGANQLTSSAAGAIVASTWYFVGCTRSGAVAKVYRNAVDITSTSGSHTNPTTSSRTAKIGMYDDGSSNPFIGTIGAVLVYSRVLTATEIRNLYLATKWRY